MHALSHPMGSVAPLLLLFFTAAAVQLALGTAPIVADRRFDGTDWDEDSYSDGGGGYGSTNNNVTLDPKEASLPVLHVPGGKGRAVYMHIGALFPDLCSGFEPAPLDTGGGGGNGGLEAENSHLLYLPSCIITLSRGLLISATNNTTNVTRHFDNGDLRCDTADGFLLSPDDDAFDRTASAASASCLSNVFVFVEEPYTTSDTVMFASGPCHAHFVVEVYAPRASASAAAALPQRRATVCIDVVDHLPHAESQHLLFHRHPPWQGPASDDDSSDPPGCRRQQAAASSYRPVFFSPRVAAEGGDLDVDDVDGTDKSTHEVATVDVDASGQLALDGWVLSTDRLLLCPTTTTTTTSNGSEVPGSALPTRSRTHCAFTATDEEGAVSFPATAFLSFVQANGSGLPSSLEGDGAAWFSTTTAEADANKNNAPQPRQLVYYPVRRVQALPMIVPCHWLDEEPPAAAGSSEAGGGAASLPKSACAFRFFTADVLGATMADTAAADVFSSASPDAAGWTALLPINQTLAFAATSESEGGLSVSEDTSNLRGMQRALELHDYYDPAGGGLPARAVLATRGIADDVRSGGAGVGEASALDTLLFNVTAAVWEGTHLQLLAHAGSNGTVDRRADLQPAAVSAPAEVLIAPAVYAICGATYMEWVSLLEVPLAGCVDTASTDVACAATASADRITRGLRRTVPMAVAFNVSLAPVYNGPNSPPASPFGKLLYKNRELLFRVERIAWQPFPTAAATTSFASQKDDHLKGQSGGGSSPSPPPPPPPPATVTVGGCFFHAVLLRRLEMGDVLLSEADLAWLPEVAVTPGSLDHLLAAEACDPAASTTTQGEGTELRHVAVVLQPLLGGHPVCRGAEGGQGAVTVHAPSPRGPPPPVAPSQPPQQLRRVVRKRQLFQTAVEHDADGLLDAWNIPSYLSSSGGSGSGGGVDMAPTVVRLELHDAVPYAAQLLQETDPATSGGGVSPEAPLLLQLHANGFETLMAGLRSKGLTYPVSTPRVALAATSSPPPDGGGGEAADDGGASTAITPDTLLVVPPTIVAMQAETLRDATLLHAFPVNITSFLAGGGGGGGGVNAKPGWFPPAVLALTGPFAGLAHVSPTFPRSLISPRKRFVFCSPTAAAAGGGSKKEEAAAVSVVVDTVLMGGDGVDTPELELDHMGDVLATDGGTSAGGGRLSGVSPRHALTTMPYVPSAAEQIALQTVQTFGPLGLFQPYILPDVADRSRRRTAALALGVRLHGRAAYNTEGTSVALSTPPTASPAVVSSSVTVTFTIFAMANLERMARLVLTKVPRYCSVLVVEEASKGREASPPGALPPDDWQPHRAALRDGAPLLGGGLRFYNTSTRPDRFVTMRLALNTTLVASDAHAVAQLLAAHRRRGSSGGGGANAAATLADEVRFAAYTGTTYPSNEIVVRIDLMFLTQEAETALVRGPTDAPTVVLDLGGTGSSASAMEVRILVLAVVVVVGALGLRYRRHVVRLGVAVCCPARRYLLVDEDDEEEANGNTNGSSAVTGAANAKAAGQHRGGSALRRKRADDDDGGVEMA